jgi:hypothetical protein
MADDQETEADSQLFLKDLSVLASLPHAVVSALATDIASARPFVNLENLVSQHLSDPEAAEAVSRLAANLDQEHIPDIADNIRAAHQSAGAGTSPFTDDSLEQLCKNLAKLVTSATALVVGRTKKAIFLSTATGNEATGLTFVCDARPVYDDARSAIEGYVPLITMKLEFTRPNEQRDAIEFPMTPLVLDTVIALATQARSKLTVMQKTFSQWLPSGTGEDPK